MPGVWSVHAWFVNGQLLVFMKQSFTQGRRKRRRGGGKGNEGGNGGGHMAQSTANHRIIES